MWTISNTASYTNVYDLNPVQWSYTQSIMQVPNWQRATFNTALDQLSFTFTNTQAGQAGLQFAAFAAPDALTINPIYVVLSGNTSGQLADQIVNYSHVARYFFLPFTASTADTSITVTVRPLLTSVAEVYISDWSAYFLPLGTTLERNLALQNGTFMAPTVAANQLTCNTFGEAFANAAAFASGQPLRLVNSPRKR